MLSHQTVVKIDYDYGLLQSVLDHVEQRPELMAVPAVSIYYHCYRALSSADGQHDFAQFKLQLDEHYSLFTDEEIRDLYIIAINFCIRQHNMGNAAYLNLQFELYRTGFERGYFLVHGHLSRYTYLNATTIGLVMQQPDWVADFLPRFQPHLQEAYRESQYCFNFARLEHYRGNYEAALVLLQKAEYKDLMLNLAVKTLQSKIYYDLGETILLDSHLQAIAAFIRRKKGLGYHRENYRNMIHFLQKRLKIAPNDKITLNQLHDEIVRCRAVVEKSWLLSITVP
jgi:tetratricopeptide (TPR) repeat protein